VQPVLGVGQHVQDVLLWHVLGQPRLQVVYACRLRLAWRAGDDRLAVLDSHQLVGWEALVGGLGDASQRERFKVGAGPSSE
jgi:hypothetical protein